MHPSRPRNRKPVTYGSSRNRSISKTTSGNDSSDAPRETIPSRLSYASIPGHKNGDKRSRTPGTINSSTSTGSQQPTDDSIYDIPSSGDETNHLILRRKRRRADPKSSQVPQEDPKSITKENGKQNGGKSLGARAVKEDTESSQASTSTVAQSTKPPQRPKRDVPVQQPSPKKPKTTPIRAKAPVIDTTMSSSSSEDELQKEMQNPQSPYSPYSAQKLGSATRPTSKPSISPSSQKRTEPTTGNTTPGRRRLVDALGARERSIERESSNGLTDSQLSSPVSSQSPIRARGTGPLNISSDTQREGIASEPTVAPSSHLAGSKVTYARQRSFLDDLNLSGDLSAGLEDDDPFSPKKLAATLPRAHLYEMEDVANDDGAVRSIHELRQAGGNARYRSAMESMFEDIEDTHISVSGRCSALAQICGKLLVPKQATQFVECGFDKRIVDCLSRDLDLISAVLVFSAFGLSSAGRSLSYIIATTAWPKLLDTAPLLLAAESDVSVLVRAKENNLSKATQGIVQDIVPQIKSKLFAEYDVSSFSPCLLALECLKMTISAFQKKGETPSGISTGLLKQLVKLLISECSIESKNPLGASPVLILGLFILEAHTTSSNLLRDEYCDTLKSLSALHNLLQVPEESNETAQQAQNLYIRVILNVTNSSATLCDDYATPAMVESLAEIVMSKFKDMNQDTLSQPEGQSSLDTVILTLGALINLTEQSERSRVIFLNSSTDSQTLLGRLLSLFLERVESTAQADSVPEVHHNVAVGYLAVLLLSLCLDSDVRYQIKETLRTKGLGLSVVMSTVDEFMQYHRKIEQELHPMQNSNETGGFLGRLQDLVGQVQLTEG